MEENNYQLIDGKKVRQKVLTSLKEKVLQNKQRGIKPPHLVLINVGDDPASHLYLGVKQKACDETGILSSRIHFDTISTDALLTCIDSLNKDESINAILVQLPLPSNIETNRILEFINPIKDVDGFHPYNVGKLWQSLDPYFFPCTALGVYRLLEEYQLNLEGKNVTIINRSNIVGKPLAAMLSQKSKLGNATVTVAHSKTKDLETLLKNSDVIITGVGKPNFITESMVKKGAIVIDVGISIIRKDGKNKTVGDVDFEKVAPLTSYITPVPGGVGPMTVAMLMQNILKAQELQNAQAGKDMNDHLSTL